VEVRWSLRSAEDLERIHERIDLDSPHYAALVIHRILNSVERLAAFPESGRIVPELGGSEVREVILPPYRIVYRVQTESVEIVTVFHSARQFPNT
jgi:toxin ParE1/3/4